MGPPNLPGRAAMARRFLSRNEVFPIPFLPFDFVGACDPVVEIDKIDVGLASGLSGHTLDDGIEKEVGTIAVQHGSLHFAAQREFDELTRGIDMLGTRAR